MTGGLVIAYVLLSWASVLFFTGVTALLRRIGSRERPVSRADLSGVQVLLVRPCAGVEPGLRERLLSVAEARWTSDLRVVFTLAEPDDPARPVVEAARQELLGRGLGASVFVGAVQGPNRKAAQLAALVEAEPFGALLLSADSDVDLRGVDLDLLVQPLVADAALGAVFAPPAEQGGIAGQGDRVSHAFLNGSLHSFPLLSVLDPRGFVGKLFALRRRAALAADLRALVDYLGEDMELARRLRGAGFGTRPLPWVARSLASGRTFEQVVSRYVRWILVIRAQRPWLLVSYPLLFGATTPIVVLASGVALATSGLAQGFALIALGVAVVARLGASVLGRSSTGTSGGPMGPLVDWLLGDLVVWVAFARALVTRRVVWRGQALRIRRDGRLVAATAGEGVP